jgi:hypothetical protein
MHDQVNSPLHYTSHPSGIECLEITRHMCFNLGNVIKYVWRADLKGKNIEDLKKAAFYLQDEIALREKAEKIGSIALPPSYTGSYFNMPCYSESGAGAINHTKECGK